MPNAPVARAEPTSVRSALAGRPPTSAGPLAQTQAEAREARPTDGHMRGQAAAGAAERTSLARRSARCGGRLPAASRALSLPRGSASVLRQQWGKGREMRSRRGRQVACREAIGVRMASRRAMARGFETRLRTSRAAEKRWMCSSACSAPDHAEQVGTRPSINWGPPEWWWIAAEAGPRA